MKGHYAIEDTDIRYIITVACSHGDSLSAYDKAGWVTASVTAFAISDGTDKVTLKAFVDKSETLKGCRIDAIQVGT